jgi:hypothetical protein
MKLIVIDIIEVRKFPLLGSSRYYRGSFAVPLAVLHL